MRETHTEQRYQRSTEPRALTTPGVLRFQGTLFPQVWVFKECHSHCETTAGRDETAQGALHRRTSLCELSVETQTWGSAGFQIDFLSFIFLSKGLITSHSPDCMGIMTLFYPYQYNAQ